MTSPSRAMTTVETRMSVTMAPALRYIVLIDQYENAIADP